MEALIKKYLWILTLAGILLCTYFLAKIVNTFIRDRLMTEREFVLSSFSAPPSASKAIANFDQYRVIVDRNLFDSREPETVPTLTPIAETLPTAGPNLEGPAVRSALPFKVLSTFSVGEGTGPSSSATIQPNSGGGADVYTVNGEKSFSPGVKIVKILSDRIEFVNNNRLEYLELDPTGNVPKSTSTLTPVRADRPSPTPTGVLRQGQNRFVVDQSEIDNALANLDKFFTEVRAVPVVIGGRPAGLRILGFTPNNILAKLGIQRGDVIERINGVEIDIQRGIQIFSQLRGEKRITIDVERGGQKQTLDYEIR